MVRKCKFCRLHLTRRKIVPGKGEIPADILFIGEAPGKTEDLLGEPFVGAAGILLDEMFEDALYDIEVCDPDKNEWGNPHPEMPSYYITNTVLCRPTDRIGGDNREPSPEEVLNCAPHIKRIYKKVKPKIVIFVGKVAEKYYRKEFPNYDSIQHPAFLLRQGGKASSWYITNVRHLAEIFRRINA